MTPILLWLSAALLPEAQACGGFAPQEGSLVSSDAQQALFDTRTPGEIAVTYRARYNGDAADFAWVIAVPGTITEVVEGDAAWLDTLLEASAPQVEVDPAIAEAEAESGRCGCGAVKGGMSDSALGGGDSNGVTITGQGFAGNLSYTTLAATDADGLSTWLTEHGYNASMLQGAIDAYVADPLDYEFVAVQIAPEYLTVEGVVLDPIEIHYGPAADGALHAIFPARLSQSSTVETIHTELLVLGAGTAALSGWSAPENPDRAGGHSYDVVGPDYEDPSGLYWEHLYTLGGDQPVAWQAASRDYSNEGGAAWLTRYDAVVAPSTNTIDPVFTDTGEGVESSTVIYLMEESAYEAEYTGLLLLPGGLLGLAALRRRRDRPAPR
jgi:hypothetical protein